MTYEVTAVNKRTEKEEKFSVAGPNFTDEKALKAQFLHTHGVMYEYKSCEPKFLDVADNEHE